MVDLTYRHPSPVHNLAYFDAAFPPALASAAAPERSKVFEISHCFRNAEAYRCYMDSRPEQR